ncbi:hypothetical protein [Shewanella colwelliana]|uniref:hypothetical protein n=1 Tax=Shewanella colwelliana TaxID=23 RepID=UPI0037357E49
MNSFDFQTSEDTGQFKTKHNNNFWEVDKGGTFITGRFEGKNVLEFSTKPINTKSALVGWVLRVFY